MRDSLRELTLTRFREFMREPEALFWSLLFPILLSVGLGIAFSTEQMIEPHVAMGRLVPLLEPWSAPFPGYYLCYPAQRQMAPPLRFIGLWSLHGRLDEYWVPKNSELDFDINYPDASLQPLNPYRNQLLILDGLDYQVLYEYGLPGHEGGPITFLTGSKVVAVNGEAMSTSPSPTKARAAR